MPHTGLREQRLPALNIIALATFAASLSARALDPVLPHVADDLTIKIATAASFASVFAFTFAIVQPALGAAAAAAAQADRCRRASGRSALAETRRVAEFQPRPR
jgi:predicted MFS family arabinose efflux permease